MGEGDQPLYNRYDLARRMPPPAVQFGEFELDSAAFELRRKGRPVRLERLPLEFLLLLVSRRGELVTRAEIAQKLWGDDVFVDTNTAINVVVRKARQALRDDADNPKFLLTVTSKGYRFVAAVSEEASPFADLKPDASSQSPTTQLAAAIETPPRTGNEPTESSRLRHWMAWAALGVLVVATLLIGRSYLRRQSTPPTRRIMLAVLPFMNLSGDPNQEYIVDGLTEEIITDLGQMSPEHMGVIARTSAMAYKNTDKTIGQVGRELGVDYVLEGSVRSENGKARVSAQLIRVSDQTHLWAKNYDRDLKKLLEIEDELGQTMAQQVRLKLSPQREVEFAKMRTTDPAAYDLYLKGRYYWNQRTPPGIKQSIGYFQQAVAKDPEFALAYAGLAEAYNLSYNFGLFSAKESSLQAKDAATRALELDPSIAEAHAALGKVKSHYDFDFPGAEKEFLRAIELNPNSASAHFFYSNSYLLPMGRIPEAIAENNKALELDPLSIPMNNFLAHTYAWAGDYEKSYAQFQRTIEMDPTFPLAHNFLASTLESQGRYREAIQEFQKSQLLFGIDPNLAAKEAAERLAAFEKGGEKGYWQHLLQEMLQAENREQPMLHHPGDPGPTGIAGLYARLGDKDNAFHWLDRAYEEREGQILTLLKVLPDFDSLRGDPRYGALLRKLGLPE
jgi:TolB-like protein/DNA-binding winged helix-turn-helix (wHTH) protein/Flp pilus assembly protein TadD